MTGSATGAASTTFAAVSSLVEIGPGTFAADVSPEWTIGGKPNGGYLLSLLGRSAVAVGGHGHVLAASAHYLRAPDPAAVVVEAEVMRQGRSASQVRARLLQCDVPCVEALLTVGHLDPAASVAWDGGLPAPGRVAYEDCPRLEPVGPNGMRVNIMDQIEVRLEPASCGFTQGKPSGRGELRGWLGLPASEPFDPLSLLFAVDAFPPATFDIAFAGWVPTLELTVYVRAVPAPGPVRVLQRAHLIAGQRFDESCYIWDGTGHLVAQSLQLAAIRLP